MKIAVCATKVSSPPKVGLDVHAIQMGLALARRGHDVKWFFRRVDGELPPNVPFEMMDLESSCEESPLRRSWLRRLASSHRGVTLERIGAFQSTISEYGFDTCVFAGVEGPAWLAGLRDCTRVWYAADEHVRTQLSILRMRGTAVNRRRLFREALISALYERTFGADIDACWVVSDADRDWMRWIAGTAAVDSIPNGVDLDYFRCTESASLPRRIVYWGNLHFLPNQQALEWFLPSVWQPLKEMFPDAEFVVVGHQPPVWLRQLADRSGVLLFPDAPDLRPHVCSAPIAVFPIQTGSGIKNKFLEGASMRRALLASPSVLAGLRAPVEPAWIACRKPADWISALKGLWEAPERIEHLGSAARRWVETSYTWDRAAIEAERSIERAILRSAEAQSSHRENR